uniref:Uncharacterized protein n=1 Tax=Romanomermis culicivorax TaxID=13658 RepID=A0A915K4R6_ROMCU
MPPGKKRKTFDSETTTLINIGAKMTTSIGDDETPSVVQPAPTISDDDDSLKIDDGNDDNNDSQNRSTKLIEKNVAISSAVTDRKKLSYDIVSRFLNRKKFELQILNDEEDRDGGRRLTGNWILTHEKETAFIAQQKIELERVRRNLVKIAELKAEIRKLYFKLHVEEMHLKSQCQKVGTEFKLSFDFVKTYAADKHVLLEMFAVGHMKKCADSMEAKIRQELESCLSKNADGEKNDRQCGHDLQSQNIKTLTSCISLAFRTGNLCRKSVFIEKSRVAVKSCDRHCSKGLAQNCIQKIDKLFEIGCRCVQKSDRQVFIQDLHKCSNSRSADAIPNAYDNIQRAKVYGIDFFSSRGCVVSEPESIVESFFNNNGGI